ncbi:MAG: 3-deoxy-8-phosphooctulonate synthase [Saprospiraceae bacterium]|nr:3-deoxy-8-phosphooctulonate synthase [Saprospiraceae bacterium]
MKEILENIIQNKNKQFFLIAGPCFAESEDVCNEVADYVSTVCNKLNIPYIFKASYRKANRSRIDSFAGDDDISRLELISNIAKKHNLPVTTDIHSDEEAAIAAAYVDILQIPAFLCRQTSLLVAAAKTNKVVSIKKGQFMSPEAMEHAVEKVRKSGNDNVWLIERGTTFGYQDLVVDYRGIPTMQKFNVPVIMDCTHALQQPNQMSGVTGGRPDLIPTIAKAAIAIGTDGLFIETHPNPSKALSDGANMLPLHELRPLLEKLCKIREAIQ